MKKLYGDLAAALDAFQSGSVSADGVKPMLAPSGIYQQKNGLFMARIRINGGDVSSGVLAGLAEVVERSGGYAHITSRQDLQVHDLPAGRVMEVVLGADRLGLPFKGGGGNTYRNTVASGDSGYAPEGVFDVQPYAQAVNRALLRCEGAFALPRKLKIGFFANASEQVQAAAQDLGFLAQRRDGRPGFTVYAAGGQGRESSAGLKLFEFLGAEHVVRATLALVALFHDHGDRANRHQARLRFVLKRLGPEAFLRLYLGYYAEVKAPALRAPEADGRASLVPQLRRGTSGLRAEGFELWEQIAVQATRFGAEVKSVRLYVPYGNLTGAQLRSLAGLARDYCPVPLRLLASQDLLLPMVHVSALPEIYARLRGELGDLDLTFASYRGHLVTCVGAQVCKIGMVDSPAVAERLAVALDRYLPPDTPEKRALLRLVTDELRISGCPNSCASHHTARLGIGCLNQKVDGEVQPFARLFTGAGVRDGVPHFSKEADPARLIPVAELAEVVIAELLKIAAEDAAR